MSDFTFHFVSVKNIKIEMPFNEPKTGTELRECPNPTACGAFLSMAELAGRAFNEECLPAVAAVQSKATRATPSNSKRKRQSPS